MLSPHTLSSHAQFTLPPPDRSASIESGPVFRPCPPNVPRETEPVGAGPLPATLVRFGPVLARCRQSTALEERRQCQHERPPLRPSGESHRRASRAPNRPCGHEQGAPCLGLPTDPSRRACGPLCPVAGALPPRPMECARPHGVKFIPELSPFVLSSHSTNRPVCPTYRLGVSILA